MAHQHGAPTHGRAFAIGIALNTVYVAVEIVIGLLTGSLGLIADAIHNASDVLSLIVAWVGSRLAQRSPSKRYTYGLKRSPIMASLFNALVLFGAMGFVAWEAIQRLQDPVAIPGATIIWVTSIGLVVNFGTAAMFMRGRDDLNIRGAFLHMIADGAVTLGVLLAGVAIMLTDALWLDPLISLAIVLVVLWSTWDLFLDSLRLSVDAIPSGIDPDEVTAHLRDLPGVTDIHDLHVWALSTTETALTAHLVMAEQPNDNELLARACKELHDKFEIVHATLQLEHGEPRDPCGLTSPSVV